MHIEKGLVKALGSLFLFLITPSTFAAPSIYTCTVLHLYFDSGGILTELHEKPGNGAQFVLNGSSGDLSGYLSSENHNIRSHNVLAGVYFLYEKEALLGRSLINTLHVRKTQQKDTYSFQFNRNGTIYTGSCSVSS